MTPAPSTLSTSAPSGVVLEQVSWTFYEQLLREIGDQPLRTTFHRGRLEIRSPLPEHEIWKKRIARLIELTALERKMVIESLGSTTFRDSAAEAGLEPDECYYVQNAAAIAGMTEFDPALHPPPDLAVEVDITRRSVQREPIYATLGVPELWRFDGRQLQALRLNAGAYRVSPRSGAFAFLDMAMFSDFLSRWPNTPQIELLQQFRTWIASLPA